MRLTQILCFADILTMNWDFNAICIFLNKQIEKTGTIPLPSSNGELLLDAAILHFLPFEINCFQSGARASMPSFLPFSLAPIRGLCHRCCNYQKSRRGQISHHWHVLTAAFLILLPASTLRPLLFLGTHMEVTLLGVSLSRFHICSTVQ